MGNEYGTAGTKFPEGTLDIDVIARPKQLFRSVTVTHGINTSQERADGSLISGIGQ